MKKTILTLLAILMLCACSHKATDHEAYLITQEKIKSSLENTLGTLDFPFADYEYQNEGDTVFVIKSHFTYKNEYNADVRYNYRAKVKYKGGKWEKLDNWDVLGFQQEYE